MSGLELAKRGLCQYCHAPLQHGPWTDAEVAEVAQDIGIAPEEFGDCCDWCFVRYVGLGDVEYAQKLAGRPLQP